MPFPTSEDVLDDRSELPIEYWNKFVPENLDVMVEHWVLLIRLSSILGEVLSQFYQQLANKPTLLQFEKLEFDLNSFIIPKLRTADQNRLAMFSYNHLQLHLQ